MVENAREVVLTGGLSISLTRRAFRPVHELGRMLVDLVVLLFDDGEAIADIDVLRHQRLVLGPVASAPTDAGRRTPAVVRRVEKARAARLRRTLGPAEIIAILDPDGERSYPRR